MSSTKLLHKFFYVLMLTAMIFSLIVPMVGAMSSLPTHNELSGSPLAQTLAKTSSLDNQISNISTQSDFNASATAETSTLEAEDMLQIALDYLNDNKAELGLTQADLADFEVLNQYVSSHTGVTHIYLVQRYNGIEVHNAIINVNITAKGEVFHVGNRFISNLANKIVRSNVDLSAYDAVELAADAVGVSINAPLELVSGPAKDQAQSVVFGRSDIALEDIPVNLIYQPTSNGKVYLTWGVLFYELDAQNHWDFRFDAATGKLLAKDNLVIHENFTRVDENGQPVAHNNHNHVSEVEIVATEQPTNLQANLAPDEYFVYPWPMESPNHLIPPEPDDPPLNEEHRRLEVDPATANASPFGWHDTDGNAGAEFTITRGNNVHAYEDSGNNNGPIGNEPDGGAGLVFSFTLDLTQEPDTYQDAAITNLFYWNNIIHDVMYEFGFDEVSGNFQANNYGNGGAGNDYVFAEGQDGSGSCNANFGTPADGSNPRMQMYVCGIATPTRDGDLDNNVIVHEYTHGISNRLTGGPSTTSCLNNSEQMGEGWSDFHAIWMTIEQGDAGTDARGMGTYLFGEPSTGPGIRPSPYSTDFGVNNYTYGDIGSQAVPHGVGFVWASILWEVQWDLINTYGFNPDIYGDWTTGGNNLFMQLVMDGMKLQPCNPGFVDGRDAILAADQILTGGQNQCLMWSAFARRGLGASADQGSSGSTSDGTEAFDTPLFCLSSIAGNVIDSVTTDPIENAFIQANIYNTLSDANGDYLLGVIPDTYTVTVDAFGYATDITPGIVAITQTVYTHNVALDPLPSVVVSGTVVDDLTGWPLYAQVRVEDISGDGLTVWTDPETGFYSVSVPASTDLTFIANAWVPGYNPGMVPVAGLSNDAVVDISLSVNAVVCNAPGYELAGLLLYEDFDNGIPETWEVVNNGGNCTWVDNDPGGRGNLTGGSGIFAIADSDACGSGSSTDTELLTPLMNATGFTELVIEYKNDYWDLGSTAQMDVYSGTWTTVDDLGGASARGPQTRRFTTTVGAGLSDTQVRWHYAAGWDWWWEVDEVRIFGAVDGQLPGGGCTPANGGLVVGNVYDYNSLDPLNGARVTNDTGENVISMATPDDDNVDDGFYSMFSAPGTQGFTGTLDVYIDQVTSTIVQSTTNHLNLYLKAPYVVVTHDPFSVTLVGGTSTTLPLDLTNLGLVNTPFEVTDKISAVVPLLPLTQGIFDTPQIYVEAGQENLMQAPAGLPVAPTAPLLPAGDVIQSWPAGLALPWGIGVSGNVWVANPSVGGGDDLDHEYLTDGTSTGNTIDTGPWIGSWAGDMAYNQNTGMIWQLNVGGDNCIYELDPVTLSDTGNTICPSFSTSQRGLAYDPDTDTYFAGGWNDTTIHHFDTNGTFINQVNVGLAISGLTYNPDTMHLFVMVNAPSNDVFVLDAADNFTIIGQFSVGFPEYSGAGLGMGPNGHLWAANQADGMVYEIDSGEQTTKFGGGDAPWVWEEPMTGTLKAGTPTIVDVTVSATFGMTDTRPITPGIYYAELTVETNDPINPTYSTMVTMTVPHYYQSAFMPMYDYDADYPGRPVTYTLDIVNTSSVTESFDISLDGNNWPSYIVDETGGTLPLITISDMPRLAVASLEVIVFIPADEYGNAVDELLVLSTPQTDMESVAVATLTTTALPMYGFEKEAPTTALRGLPSETVTHTVWVTNTGNTTDTFDVMVDAGWTTTSVTEVTVSRYTSEMVDVVVEIPADAVNGDFDYAQVWITSQGDYMLSELEVFVTLVEIDYGVVVEAPEDTMSGNGGDTVTYTVWITNTSDVDDDFTITANGTWTTTAPVSASLAAGEGISIEVTVELPADAVAPDFDVTQVTATSDSDSSASGSAVLVTTAEGEIIVVTPGVMISADMTSATADSGASVTYMVTVTNTGNMPDSFAVSLSGNTWTSTASLATTGELAAGASTTLSVVVDVPADSIGGAMDTVTVMATSDTDSAVMASVDLTTTSGGSTIVGPETPTVYLPIVLK